MEVGDRIRRLRKSRNLSLRDLSKRIDMSISFISDIENGRSYPSLIRLKEISEGLGCSMSYLLGETKEILILREAIESYDCDNQSKIILDKLIEDKKFIDVIISLDGFSTWTDDEKLNLINYIKEINQIHQKN